MTTDTTRWILRLDSYSKALLRLKEAVEVSHALNELEKDGIIQRFEFTHELSWKVMKDYAEYQGYTEVRGSRDAVRLAFQMQLITDVTSWLDMIKYRNTTSHTYNQQDANEAIEKITQAFYPLFLNFHEICYQLSTDQLNLFDK